MKTKIPKSEIRDPKLEDMLQKALKHHQASNFDEAAILYNKVLKIQPNNINAISLLGTLNLQTGNHEVACILLKKSLTLKPDNAMAHNNLGSALQASGRFEEAIKYYRRAIELKPDYDEAYYNLGNTLQACNLLEEAIVIYKHAIALKPNDADIHNNLANALRKSGKPDEALKSHKQAAMLKPHNTEILCNLGVAFQEIGNLCEAILNYRKAITLKPDNAKAHSNLGTALKKQCKLEEAVKCHHLAIEMKPDYAEAYNNLGSTLQSLNRLEEATTNYRKAIILKPHYAEAHYNYGNVLKEQKKFDEAFESYKRAITIKPDYAEAHNNLGITLQEQSKFVEATESYRRAIELKPDYADAHFNRSLMLLLKGNLKDGWQEYEWRLRTKDYALRDFQQPMWDGSPLNGKTILVHTEQGLGDNIQFVRYLPMVQAQGGRVIFECLPSLVHLLKNCAGIDNIIEKTSTIDCTVPFDVQVPLLSLPGIFNTTSGNIPSKKPYIEPNPTFVMKWRDRLGVNDKSFKVGLVWASNPENKEIYLKKSCKLNDFEALSEIPGLSLYSLQKGPASADVHNPPHGIKIVNLSNDLNDLSDTAAVIANLDLVISIDTVVAHLAGAIGKPVWTLLPFVPDWRWLIERNDSPWYPSMHLYRQTRLDNWDGVFEQVKKALAQRISDFRLRIAEKKTFRIPNSEIPGPDRRAPARLGGDRTRAGRNPSISLCMIVKNEEEFLSTCLESVKDHVDEIIIVDTGSTDKTVEVAKKYNAKIYHHPWENSFSKARNYSLKYATCDWILILDADEEIDKNDAHRLKSLLSESDADLIYLQVLDKTMEDKIVSVSNSERLFRNHLGIQYEGIVHNSLKYNCSTEIAADIKIFHYGYNLNEEKMERKFVRTATLLRKQIKNDPLNPMPHHFLAIAFSGRNKYDECIDEALQAIKLFELKNINTNVMLLTCYTVSVAFYNKNDLVNAEDYALKAINLYSDYLDGHFILSSIYMRQKEYDKCVYATNRYLDLVGRIKSNPVEVLQIPYNNIQNVWHALTRLTIVYFEQNRDSEGIQALKEALSIADDKNDPYLSIGKYFIEQNDFKLAEKILYIGLKDYPQSKRILYYISELYEKYNISDKALYYLKKILDIYPEEVLAQYKIGLLHMKQGQYEDAISIFKPLSDGPQDHVGALYNLGMAYELIKDISRAKEAYDRILKIEPKNTEALVRSGSLFLNDSCLYDAKECFLKTIKLGKYLLEAHLALSRIYISLNDLDSCVKSCNEILKCLDLPRNITINNLSDLSELYINIGKALLRHQKEKLSGFSFKIAELLDPVIVKRNGLL